MFAAIGSTRTAAISSPCSASAASSAARSLYGTTIVSATVPSVTPAEPGSPNVATPLPGLHQQRVEVAVVTARELHDLGAAGRAARQAHRGHRGLGARRDQPHLLDRRHPRADRLGEFDLAAVSARRTTCRRPRPAARPRRPPGARDRGSTRPTTARSRRSWWPSVSTMYAPCARRRRTVRRRPRRTPAPASSRRPGCAACARRTSPSSGHRSSGEPARRRRGRSR